MIILDGEYYIDADSNQYILKEYAGKDKHNEPLFKSLTYHRTLKEVFEALTRQKQLKLVAENELTLKETINEFTRINNETKELLKEYIKEGE